MKVLDLKCAQQHVFEGWFGSEADFQSQLAKGLVECPLCGSADIHKQLSAPRLNLGALPPAKPASAENAAPDEAHASSGSTASGALSTQISPATLAAFPEQAQALHALQALQASYLQQVRKVMANTEDVGLNFAEVARQMHYGETEERNIRGQTTPAEAVALIEEGIPVMPLAVPDALKETLQ